MAVAVTVAATVPVLTQTSQQSDPVAPRLSVALKHSVFKPGEFHLKTALSVPWSRVWFSQVAPLTEDHDLLVMGSPSGSIKTSGLKLRYVPGSTTMPSGRWTTGGLLGRSVVVVVDVVVVVLRNVGATSVGTGEPPILALVDRSAVFSSFLRFEIAGTAASVNKLNSNTYSTSAAPLGRVRLSLRRSFRTGVLRVRIIAHHYR